MDPTRAPRFAAAVLTVAAVLIGSMAGCGSQTVGTLYKVGGTVTGLNGTLKLANNGGDTLTLTASGTFQFATGLKKGAAYSVTVSEAPAGQTCTVSDGAGAVAQADVTSVAVTCAAAAYTLGGTVSGLTGTLVLANSTATVSVASGATAFAFADTLASGASYHVTVKTQPAGQRCDITGGQGSITANVNSVVVKCAATHALRAHITGLTGQRMQLANNTNDLVDVPYSSSNSSHVYDVTFPYGYVDGETCSVTVAVQPQDQDGDQLNFCTVSSPPSTFSGQDATVNVACVQAVQIRVNITRTNLDVVTITDGTSEITCSDSCVNQPFATFYPDQSTYRVHLSQGAHCIACPASNQTGSHPAGSGPATDITGTFNGSACVHFACDTGTPTCDTSISCD